MFQIKSKDHFTYRNGLQLPILNQINLQNDTKSTYNLLSVLGSYLDA